MKTRRRLMALALFSGLAVLGNMVQAQMPAGTAPVKRYTKKAGFGLPLQIDAKDRARVGEVRLYVRNGPNEPASCAQALPPTQTAFTFRAAKDGEYWFNVATVDQTGKQQPADVAAKAPELIVVVDTQPPQCEVRPMSAPSGEKFLQCDVRDANPDLSKTKLEYLANDGKWYPLEPYPSSPGFFRVSDPAVLQGKIRATVHDLAGNVGTHEIITMTAAAPAGTNGTLPPVVESQSEKIIQTSATMPASNMPQTTGTPAPAAAAQETASAAPATAETPATTSPASDPVTLIKNKRVPLAYEIDKTAPGSVSKVEVWLTCDNGQTWQRYAEDADQSSPVEFDLPSDGLFGVKLVVSNGAGDTTPAKGEAPNLWVELDSTPPTANLVAVRPAEPKGETPALQITWTAADKNLKPEPINLLYASRREGPWTPIAQGLKNDGNFPWQVPADVRGEIFLRLEAADKAGNVAACETTQAVVIDVARPKARVLGIMTTPPAQATSGN